MRTADKGADRPHVLLAALPASGALAFALALGGVKVASGIRAQALGITHRLLGHLVAPHVESANHCDRYGRPTVSGSVMAKAAGGIHRNAGGKKGRRR